MQNSISERKISFGVSPRKYMFCILNELYILYKLYKTKEVKQRRLPIPADTLVDNPGIKCPQPWHYTWNLSIRDVAIRFKVRGLRRVYETSPRYTYS